MTLDIDPLKDITAVHAEETVEEVRAGLFKRWLAVYQGVLALPNEEPRAWFTAHIDGVQKMIESEDVKAKKKIISSWINGINMHLVYIQGHPVPT